MKQPLQTISEFNKYISKYIGMWYQQFTLIWRRIGKRTNNVVICGLTNDKSFDNKTTQHLSMDSFNCQVSAHCTMLSKRLVTV